MPRKVERGQRFGRLTTLEVVGKNKKGSIWLCKCDCGNLTKVNAYNLGRVTNSCGCFLRERIREVHLIHGETHTRLFRIWTGMRTRCLNPRVAEYPNYGGRGIKICDEWFNNFTAFRDWALVNGYSDKLSIDRIDNDGNYEPSNCQWITKEEQNTNKRNNIYLSYNEETHTVKEWSRLLNVSYSALIQRVHHGWDVERILTTPVRQRRRAS